MFLRSAGPGMFLTIATAALLAAAPGVAPAQATVPYSEVHTIAAPTTAVPQEYTFSVSTAGTYTVTLTDLGAALTPAAPLASVELAVSRGEALVGTPLVGAGTLTLASLAPGDYVLHVIGMPGNVAGSGPFGIAVDDPSMMQIESFQGTLALPSQALPNGESVLDDSLSVQPGSGSACQPPQTGAECYTIALTDLQLPKSFTTLTLLLIAQGGSTPVVTLPNNGAMQATVALTPGVTYRIFAVGAPDTTVNAGLYTVVLTPSGGGPVLYGHAVPAGYTQLVGSPAVKAGSDTFSLADLQYPAALAQVAAVLTLNGQVVGQLNAPGSQAFTAVAGTYAVYAVATAATAATGAGSYAVQVAPSGGTPWMSVGRGVTAQGSALSAYGFDGMISTAGTYTASLTDFQFPAALTSAALAVVQGGALLGTPLSAPGSLSVNAASGPISAVVFAQNAAGGGLFGVLAATGTATPALDVTQAVGALFNAQKLSVTGSGSYSVTATDLGFPAIFANYDTIVTQGSSRVGSIFGGGTFNFQGTAGTYWINFIAQPAAPALAGTYALSVGTAPPPPVVNLSVDQPQVGSGSTVNLIWSSQNATTCTASGGWSGNQALSGTATTAALTTTTTFTLSCTGAGGTQSAAVTVTVNAAGSGGGGGSISPDLLALLLGALLLRVMGEQGIADGRHPRLALTA